MDADERGDGGALLVLSPEDVQTVEGGRACLAAVSNGMDLEDSESYNRALEVLAAVLTDARRQLEDDPDGERGYDLTPEAWPEFEEVELRLGREQVDALGWAAAACRAMIDHCEPGPERGRYETTRRAVLRLHWKLDHQLETTGGDEA